MKLSRILIIAIITLLSSQIGLSQARYNSFNKISLKEGTSMQYKTISAISNSEKTKYSGKKEAISSTPSTSTSALSWGIGIRLGDPSGISLKKYLNNNRAFEVSVGRTSIFRNNRYYDNQFNSWYLNQQYGYKKFDYLGYKSSTPLGVQVHYLLQKNLLENDISGLKWYFGFGGQVRLQTIVYDYRYKVYGDDNWYYSQDKSTNIDLGADGVIGLEYNIPNVPISIFTDATLFMEIADNPFSFWFQGGFGGRFNF